MTFFYGPAFSAQEKYCVILGATPLAKKSPYMRRLILSVVLAGFSGTSIRAQAAKDLPLIGKYKNEQAVFLERRLDAQVEMQGNAPVVVAKYTEDLLVLTEQASEYAEKKLYSSSFVSLDMVKAASYVYDAQGREKIFPVSTFKETNELSDVSFYDDYKAKSFVFPSLGRGAHARLTYSETYKEPRFFGRFFFNTYAPAELAEVTFTVPKGVSIGWKIFHSAEGDIEHTVKEAGGKTVHSWKSVNRKRFDVSGDAPSISYYTPHIVLYVTSYTVDKEEKKLLGTPDLLFDWYKGMIAADITAQNDELKKLTDSITAGTTDEAEKMKRIFYWVQDHVKYVAFEDGMGGFVPRKASLVCERRFGDCKDMASIITGMAQTQGISSVYLTWIGSRSIPYSYFDVPTPLSDNHMIATYEHNGKYYFLDATGKKTPWGRPTAFIQEKEALIHKGDRFEIVKVPVVPAEENMVSDSTTLRIEGSLIMGSGEVTMTGYPGIYNGERIQNMDNDKKRTEFLAAMVSKGSNKFTAEETSASIPDDRAQPLRIRYKWKLDSYVQTNGDEIYLNPMLEKPYQKLSFDTTLRKVPFEFDYRIKDRSVVVIEIPAGYEAQYVPENNSFRNDKFGFDIRFTRSGNKITVERTIHVDTMFLQPSDFAEWNKMIRKLNKSYKETILFKKRP